MMLYKYQIQYTSKIIQDIYIDEEEDVKLLDILIKGSLKLIHINYINIAYNNEFITNENKDKYRLTEKLMTINLHNVERIEYMDKKELSESDVNYNREG